jgi:hypothetical protein
MTLVLTLATPDVVIQVADRRLVNALTGETMSDNTNKSVSYCGSTSFAYTGLAKIGRDQTDEWLASTIASQPSMFEVLRMLANDASAAFGRIRVPDTRWKRHTFVGAGWATRAPGAPLSPCIWSVSNCVGLDFMPLAEPTPEFRILTYECSGVPFVLNSVGQSIPTSIKRELKKNIERCLSRQTSALPLAELMVRAVRNVALTNSAVGRGLLISAIPRAALEADTPGILFLASEPMPDERTFLYISEGNETATQLAPIYVCHGMTMSNFIAQPLEPEDPVADANS